MSAIDSRLFSGIKIRHCLQSVVREPVRKLQSCHLKRQMRWDAQLPIEMFALVIINHFQSRLNEQISLSTEYFMPHLY